MAGHRVVFRFKGCNLSLARKTTPDKRGEQCPTQVDVEVESHEGFGALVQAAHCLKVLGENCAVRELADEELLLVGVGTGGARHDQQRRGNALLQCTTTRGCNVGFECLVEVAQVQPQHGCVALCGQGAEEEHQVIARRHFAIAGHIPS